MAETFLLALVELNGLCIETERSLNKSVRIENDNTIDTGEVEVKK